MTDELKNTSEYKCCHYWIVGLPQRGISNAICKFCGTHKEIHSTFEDKRWIADPSADMGDTLKIDELEHAISVEE
jgi:hypothetical protein